MVKSNEIEEEIKDFVNEMYDICEHIGKFMYNYLIFIYSI